MIEPFIEYGSALYWALLFFGIYFITVVAEQRTSTLRPNLWAATLFIGLVGFTSWHPDLITLGLGILAYLMIGTGIAVFKWVELVGRIHNFTKAIESVGMPDDQVRCLAQSEFQPNDADECMRIPPDPFEFRTRLWLWLVYWPSFTFLRPLTKIHKVLAVAAWNTLSDMSKEIYESRDYR